MTSDPAYPRLRLFFALWPPANVRAELARVSAQLAAAAAPGATRMQPDNLHLTLEFLGSIDAGQERAARAIAATVEAAAFDLVIDSPGCFPRAGVGWLGPHEHPAALLALRASLHAGLRDAGLRLEAALFTPHVTCLRGVREVAALDSFRIDWPVAEFVLVRSDAGNHGSDYSVIGRWPLQPV